MTGLDKKNSGNDKDDFHGGTVIGKDGKETAITEDMVRDAILELDPDAFQDTDTREQLEH
tara:strand:- start:3154 stop:3333 length:180 start_codon:yes stop_codon:yes gene_type:complete